MKKLNLLSIALLLALYVSAQAPQAFKYQAVARDNAGNVLANRNVSFKISIVQGSVSGAVVYSELHARTTNAFGLVDLEIGRGTSPTGSFAAINWGGDQFFVKVEMDPAGGVAFQTMGTSQLLSVPYALYAKEVQNGDNWGTGYVRTDATLGGQGTVASPLKIAQQGAVSGQTLKWNGTLWSPADDLGSLWSKNGSNLYYLSGNVGIGKANPNAGLQIYVDNQYGLSVDNTSTLAALWAGNSGTGPAAQLKGKIRIVDGSEGTGKILTSDANGLGTWVAPSVVSTTPGGVAGNVQFNGGGVFAGDNNLFWNNSTKRLGIGTASPAGALDINLNSSTGAAQLQLTETELDYSRLTFKNTTNATKMWTIAGKPEAVDGNSLLNFWYWNGTSGSDIMSINGNGNVGIGIYNPPWKLSINGGTSASDVHLISNYTGTTSGDGLRVGMSGTSYNAWVWNNENGKLYFGTNDQERLSIMADGKVGIGTNTPDATLEVDGSVKVGSAGINFNEIREITGTTSASGNYTNVSYPSGYNMTNMRVLTLDVNYAGSSWIGLGGTNNPTANLEKIFYYLNTSNIVVYVPTVSTFQGKAFRMLVMKVE